MSIYPNDRRRAAGASREEAEAVAIRALGFVAQDTDLLHRFVAISGIEPGDIRAAANEPGFLAGVLQFILAHEPTLESFCAESGLNGATVAASLRALPFGETSAWE